MPQLRIEEEEIVILCLDTLDEIATTHADGGTLRKLALKGIKNILEEINKKEHE